VWLGLWFVCKLGFKDTQQPPGFLGVRCRSGAAELAETNFGRVLAKHKTISYTSRLSSAC
jgi:hypothetical protein